MNLLEHGRDKFPVASIITSSVSLGWDGIAAEVRAHPAGELPPFTSSQTEITIALSGKPGAVVARSAGGMRQETRVERGTIWISPAGIQEEATRITAPLTDIVHIYLPSQCFQKLAGADGSSAGAQALDYVADVRDDLIRQIGLSIVAEMRSPSPGGRILAESLALSMAARIMQRYSSASAAATRRAALSGEVIDDIRIRRVIDYMMAKLEEPIGLDELAAIACLSPFHFVRTFRMKAGAPPHRFLAVLRLEHAKTLLARTDRPISDIALSCQFSSQTNFTRAFRQYTRMTPNAFRSLR